MYLSYRLWLSRIIFPRGTVYFSSGRPDTRKQLIWTCKRTIYLQRVIQRTAHVCHNRHNMRSTIYDSQKSVNDMECEDEKDLVYWVYKNAYCAAYGYHRQWAKGCSLVSFCLSLQCNISSLLVASCNIGFGVWCLFFIKYAQYWVSKM